MQASTPSDRKYLETNKLPPQPRPVLYCTVLYCTVLYCTVLYSVVLYCLDVYRDAGIDPKYLETDELPPQPRPSVSVVSRTAAAAGAGGGSSLINSISSVRRNKDFIQGSSVSHPLSQPLSVNHPLSGPPQFSQPARPPQLPPRVAQVPLTSSYFPNKAS